jgi:hypothetical protein
MTPDPKAWPMPGDPGWLQWAAAQRRLKAEREAAAEAEVDEKRRRAGLARRQVTPPNRTQFPY